MWKFADFFLSKHQKFSKKRLRISLLSASISVVKNQGHYLKIFKRSGLRHVIFSYHLKFECEFWLLRALLERFPRW